MAGAMKEQAPHDFLAGADALTENEVLRAALADAQRRLQAYEEQAETDALTGLADGRRFARALERVAGVAGRHGTTAAVLAIEVQGLDAIEAAHGAMGRDAAVVHVARTLTSLIRTTDLLARTGEGEFGLILDHLDHDSAIDTAERLQRCIAAAPLDLGHAKLRIGVIACATALLAGDSAPDVLLRSARNLALACAER
jgi:diguanylate cyclase (GGDEF)-like protein